MLKKIDKNLSTPHCPICQKNKKIFLILNQQYNLYFCNNCNNGFTHPLPKKLEEYYHDHYWLTSHLIGKLKNFVFDIFQKRRINWLTNKVFKGNILDVGSGEARFAQSLPKRYKVISLEPTKSKVNNKLVIKKDFLEWKTNLKFDAITFWESLEHTPDPKKYLDKAYSLLKDGGFIFIEFPRYASLESKMFRKYWFHLDLPRHLFHFTDKGIQNMLTRLDLKIISFKSILSFDYAPWGFVASILKIFNISATDKTKTTGSILSLLFIIPLFIVSVPFEIILILLGQSPIGLVIAQKRKL